jgi:Xaa-Pro aminopeptidase
VRTQHLVLKRGGFYWDRALLPREVFDTRLREVQAAIAASGDEAWLIYGDAQGYGDIAFVSHFVPRLRSALMLVHRDQPPTLLANVGLRDIPASKTLTWCEDVRPFSRLPHEVVKLIRERGLEKAKLGLVGTEQALPIAEWDAIEGELPGVTWTVRDEAFRRLRARKDPAERTAVRAAAEVVRRGLETAREAFRVGTTMRRATALIDRAMRLSAAEDVRILVASGPQCGIALRPPDDRTLTAGAVILLFIAVEVQRHWVEAAQTYVLGAASPELAALAAKAGAAVDAMQAGARAYIPVTLLAAAAEKAIGDPGLLHTARAYGFGHGIGLDQEEPPLIERSSFGSVPENGALALHVVLHGGGIGAAAGRTVAVERDGATALVTTTPLIELHNSLDGVR